MAYIFDEHKGKQDFETAIKPKLDALKTTFQDNVNSMYNALVGKGKTPTAKTPAAISTAITNIFDDVYTKFVNQGTTPSAKTVSGMSSAVDALATAKYNAGNTAGYNSGKTDGYNNGVAATKKGNAGAGDVLSGKTFTNSSSVNAAGTMPNKGAWTSKPTGSGKTTIPAGYHNGSGYVDTSSVYNAGYNNGVAATKKGNAGVGDVLSGKTFTNSSSVNATGTMPNKGAWNGSVNVGGSVTIPQGYHSGGGKVTAVMLNKAENSPKTTKKGDILIAFSRSNGFAYENKVTLIKSDAVYGQNDTVPCRIYLVNADGGGLSGWDTMFRVYSG